jgi:RHS repeat-associated protein
VLTQDANLRSLNRWNFIKYDVQGRAIVQGYYTDATNLTQAAMQTYVDGMAASYATTWYEGRSSLPANGYYTNNVFPTTGTTLLACSYYDNYDMNYDGSHAPEYSYAAQGLTGEGTATANTRGMLTISRYRSVGLGVADTWFTKVMFYDKRGNVIQVQSNNQLVSATLSDVATSVPDFTGVTQIAKVVKTHGTGLTTTVLSTYSYDHMLRVTAIKQKYNADTEKTVATYEYNELGQLIDKKLGVNGAAFLQSVDYRYNIRGQLLSINNSKLQKDTTTYTNDDSNDVFGEELSYNISNTQVGSTGTWSGQLTAVKWMSLNGTNTKSNERSYKYLYDNLGRFTQAIYAERLSTATPASSFTLNANGFTEKVTAYDENGNIQALQRYSSTVGGSAGTKIDGLKYTYDTNNLNKLLTVTDTTANSAGFRNYTGSTGSYTYDAAGNLKTDPYKGITAIAYNTLNRVDKVTLTYPSATGRYIDYTYDASGKLLRKRQYDNSALVKTTDYIDGFVYTTAGAGAAQLDYFGMPEGRVRNTGGATITLKQEFIITDHQGNARVSFEDSGTGTAKVVQENSYYAYGMSMTSTMALPTQPNKQLYNGGSEWQNDYQDQPDWQQTFYRNYDAALGRFLAVDPMADATSDMSVYQYGNNNPVAFNDPLGNLSAAYGRILQQIEGADRYLGRESLGWADETMDRFQFESNMEILAYQRYFRQMDAIGAVAHSLAKSIFNSEKDGEITDKVINLTSDILSGSISIKDRQQVMYLSESIRNPSSFNQSLISSYEAALIGSGAIADPVQMKGYVLQEVKISEKSLDLTWYERGATIIGLNTSLHESAFKMAESELETAVEMAGKYGKVLKYIGQAAGFAQLGTAAYQFYDKPTAAGAFKVIGSGIMAFGKFNPYVGLASAILDLTGTSDEIYNVMGDAYKYFTK